VHGVVPLPKLLLPFEARRLAVCLAAACVWLCAHALASAGMRRALVSIVPLAVYVELYVAFANVVALPETHPDLYTLPPAVVTYLHEHQGYDRTYLPLRGDELIEGPSRLPRKAGMLHRIYAVGDRENVYPARYAEYVAYMEQGEAPSPVYLPQGEVVATPQSAHPRLLDLMSARWIVVGDDVHDAWAGVPGFVPVHSADGVKIYENPAALPRAYIVHRAELIPDPPRVLARLAAPDFDPRTTVVLEEQAPLPGEATASSEAHITRYAEEEVDIETRLDAPGILVLTDQHYPGWRVEVDGTPTKIYRANYLFRAVPLSPGTHKIHFSFCVTRG
jgi:hypothetical protein